VSLAPGTLSESFLSGDQARHYTVLIPARLSSTRLPNKPLADLNGVPMVVRVAQRALQSRAARVVVAADDTRIIDACNAHGIESVLTRKDHVSAATAWLRPASTYPSRATRL
jgi:3-deoxy-manno-octulosonate cytidylyltransferase (CMP-KDO synthetase)